jgi:hypothetical protein
VKRDNAQAGTGGGKEAMYNENDLLILDILGKDNPVEGSDGDYCFHADETAADQRQAHICIADGYTLTIFCQRWKQEYIHRH